MSSIYKIYRNRLIEISGKSRSLYSKNAGSKKQAYNIGKLLANPTEALRFVEFLKSGSKRHFRFFEGARTEELCKGLTPVQKKKVLEAEANSLKSLKREIESIEQETGRYELFVGYPFVEGGIGGGVLAKAPLILYPVRLSFEAEIPEIELIPGEPVLLNKVLMLAYAKENRINIEDMVMEFDNIGAEFESVDNLCAYLKKFDISIKNPKQNIVCDIEKTPELTAKDNLTVRNFAVLGRFPLANSIYYDYIQMEKKKLSSPALDAILNNKEPKFKDKKPEDYYPIHQPDFSQEKSLEFIGKYNNAVIHGPPGTGKSQTITNIISDALCKNKRVLVVSQKRTALDVIFNRLGNLSRKAMILPDPEKSKNEFYDRARARYAEAIEYKNIFDGKKLESTQKNIQSELADLKLISDVLYTKTAFGLSLQQMYLSSSRLGKNAFDYKIYAAMQQNRIIKMNYPELFAALTDIKEKNKGQLFYNHYRLVKKNPVINYIKTGLDLDRVNRLKNYIKEILDQSAPFNFAKSPYSRLLMAYNVETGMRKDLRPLSEMVARLENPKIYKKIKVSAAFPLFWPAYPFFKAKARKIRNRTQEKLTEAQLSVRDYIVGFDLLEEALQPEGLAMIIDGISHGNTIFLAKFGEALDDYLKLKDIINTLKTLDLVQIMLLEFAFENSKDEKEFLDVLDNLMSIRIYHELIREEKNREESLSKLITFEDIRNKIVCLCKQKLELSGQKAMDKFNDDFKNKIKENHEKNKNFLHQINKQNKLWPVRRLFEHFEDFLFDLFPCWLLSPEAVSAILPLKADLFDYVIFDEASQIFIEHTIPTIYRGRHLVVAGDSKQLRPTSVFIKRYMGDDTYSPELELNVQAAVEVESLLDLATSRLKEAHLTYHYRSRYEELINFSNYAFYNGRLQIAPNSSRYRDYLPIERIKVSGRWIDRKNPIEAQEVARLVANLLKVSQNKTIGIVTFNIEQQECIEDTLDALCEKDEEFKTLYLKEKNRREDGEYKGIFVKNLENVQGDERDIMIFSTAYAKNEEGKLGAQFGTLSLAGGENRLNVAVTRAREKIFLVTSVEPEEFVTIDTAKNAGPKLFKKYLQYARAVSEKDTATVALLLDSLLQIKPVKPPVQQGIGLFEQSLKAELEKSGLLVDINLGNADYKLSLAVYDKQLDRYILGLECDYAAYNSSESVLERDVYRNSFLESRGWKIIRVWSRDWWLNRAALIRKILHETEKQKQKLAERAFLAKKEQAEAKRIKTQKTSVKATPAEKSSAKKLQK